MQVMSLYVTSRKPAEYVSKAVTKEGRNTLSIGFSNDYWNPETGEDRNLYVKSITIEYLYPDYHEDQ
jgi:hypothetical protein